MKKIKTRAKKFYNKLIKTMKNPVMQILPGQIAFFFLLSIFPIILVLGIIAPIFSISIDTIVDAIELSLPANTSKLIVPLVQGKGLDFNVIIIIVSAIFLISRGTKSIIIAASTIYKTEEQNPIKNMVKSIIITILLVLLFIFIAIISVFGGRILKLLSFIDVINSNLIIIYDILRWPMTFFVIFFFLKIIYTLAPNKKISSKEVNYGAIITTILWVIATAIYSYYITHFSSYNIFYGSAANIVILMLWIYIISYIFVFGMVINATNDKIKIMENVNKKEE